MVFPGLRRARPSRRSSRFLAESRAALAETKALDRRVGLRRCSHAADGGRAGHPGDGTPPRLRRSDALPLALGSGRVRRRRPERQPVRDRPPLARRTSCARCAAPALGRDAVAQDFSLGRDYGPAEVRAQIKACARRGSGRVPPLGPGCQLHRRRARAERASDPLSVSRSEPSEGRPLARPPARSEAGAEACRDAGAACRSSRAPGLAVERARPDPDRDAPHGAGRPCRRLRPDAGGVSGRARATSGGAATCLSAVGDIVTGRLDVPKGMTPVGFTFDDATIVPARAATRTEA